MNNSLYRKRIYTLKHPDQSIKKSKVDQQPQKTANSVSQPKHDQINNISPVEYYYYPKNLNIRKNQFVNSGNNQFKVNVIKKNQEYSVQSRPIPNQINYYENRNRTNNAISNTKLIETKRYGSQNKSPNPLNAKKQVEILTIYRNIGQRFLNYYNIENENVYQLQYINNIQSTQTKNNPQNNSPTFQRKSSKFKLDRSLEQTTAPIIQNITVDKQQNQINSNGNGNQTKNIITRSQLEQHEMKVQKNFYKLDGGNNTETCKDIQQSVPIPDFNIQLSQQQNQIDPIKTSIETKNEDENVIANQNNNRKIQIQYLDFCDCIQLQMNSNNSLVLSQFTIYFGQFNIQTSQKEGNGCLLQKCFDKGFNSSYFHYQGQFKNDQIFGYGKLYNQKSKMILQEGEWTSIQNNLGRQPEIAIKPRLQKIKILNMTDLKNETSEAPKQYKRVFKSNSTTAFHDQLLNQKDLNILLNKAWLNSSIIDAYVEHLNYQDEIHYWTLSKENRKLYERVQIIPSWLFSWFHQSQEKQNFQQFKGFFSQFEPINFRIWEIYKKIGFVINQSNSHWYFIQLNFQTMEILVKDSIRGSIMQYASTKEIIKNLFNQIDNEIQFTLRICDECLQQRNSYDCGAYTCMNAKELVEGKKEGINDGTNMRKIVMNVILQKNS